MPAQTGRTQPIAPQPSFTPRSGPPGSGGTSWAPGNGPTNGTPHGNGTDHRSRAPGGRLSRIWQGSLSGGLGVWVIVGSAVIGTIATIVTKSQPGSVLGLFVLAGTVAAALTVQPQTGRLIFPVPALSYLIGALVSGVFYDRSSNKTEIAVGAAQWVANGFFVMVLATLLAIALTTVRWFMWRRDQRDPVPPDWSGPAVARNRTAPRPQAAPPLPAGSYPGTLPPGPGGTRGRDPRAGPRPDQGLGRGPDQPPGPRPGTGPYNFSSGA
jgi:hypothetical protein